MGVEGLEGVGSSRKAEPVAGGVRLVFKTARVRLVSFVLRNSGERGGYRKGRKRTDFSKSGW